MLQLGLEPRTALATNMLALTFMSLGATLPFLSKQTIDFQRLPLLLILTLVGSLAGAGLVFIVPTATLPHVISILMLAMVGVAIAQPKVNIALSAQPSGFSRFAGYSATLILGVYGGFFSGGYVTLLTMAYTTLFRMTLVEAIAMTKPLNIVSSLVATLVFATQGIVDYQLGFVLGAVMFTGGWLGSRFVLKMSDLWLRRIFVVSVIVLALKTLLK
jgi:uncharacterized membrane protein YfcA